MKFNHGCWLLKEGIGCFSPTQVYHATIKDKEVILCAPTHPMNNRGDTLGGANLTIRITSPLPDVIRVQTVHHMGTLPKGPAFELQLGTPQTLQTDDTEDTLTVTSGSLSLEIGKKNWYMRYIRGGKTITASGAKDLAMMKENWTGDCFDLDGDLHDTWMRQQLSIGVGELFYGTGERFTPFVKNGQTVEIYNEDGGTSTEQSYKNIPFYLSNKGYGILVNHPERVSFEFATENVTKTSFCVKGGILDYFFFNGPTMKEVLMRYTDLTGKPSLPAPWTFGLWLSTSFTTDYDEETVMRFIDGMLERDIPLRTFHFDCFWMKGFHWSEFVWDDKVFPDPVGMLRRIKAKGLNICVWINPYIGQESVLFTEGMEKGYFLRRPNGDVWQWDMWQPGMALVDFTNPVNGIRTNWKRCSTWALTVSRPISANGFRKTVSIMTVLRRKKCTIFTHTSITRPYMNCWKKSAAGTTQFCSPAPPPWAVRNFPFTGAVTAGPIMNRWKKVCAAACPC